MKNTAQRLLALCLAMLLCVTLLPAPASAEGIVYGDANGDGKVNGKDAIMLAQYLAGWEVTIQMAAMDVNQDGKINGKDAIFTAQYLAGWEVTLGPQEPEVTEALRVAASGLNGSFSPFFSKSDGDQTVVDLTQLSLLGSDRNGRIIQQGIEGETQRYNGVDYTYYGPASLSVTQNDDGSVFYDFTLRDDLVFSDGEPLTIDDVIFSMYVLSDPTYDGTSTFYALPIRGLEAYRAAMGPRGRLIFEAGSEGYTATDYYTEAQYNAFWDYYNNKAGLEFTQEIVDYVFANYSDYTEEYLSRGCSEAHAAAALWGFKIPENATVEDFWNAMVEAYGGDLAMLEAVESAGSTLYQLTVNALGSEYQRGVSLGEGVDSIEGIQKTGDHSLRIVLDRFDATTIYTLGVSIAPMHYYGDASLFDYDNHSFGFPKGDLSSVRAKTGTPLGAGPYCFKQFKDGELLLEANHNYYKGAPETQYIKLLTNVDHISAIPADEADITAPAFSSGLISSIKSANGNGSLVGPVYYTVVTDNLGYGYIGLNAANIKVGSEPGSEASKALRKAIATVLAVFREEGVRNYYGDRAKVIEYPISSTSWAAPQPGDVGYRAAFSVDVNGLPLYAEDMTQEEKLQAALQAALGWFEAAGYTVEDGKLTAAPEGAKLEYTLWIPASGVGDHPAFMIADEARKALETIGMSLAIKDLSNSSELWDNLDAIQVEMWAAAWGATVDPDMYQIYFSDVANGPSVDAGRNPYGGPAQGGSNYEYCIADAALDRLILQARESLDQGMRKTLYKQALDIILDWGVELPYYQRQNCVLFSTQRVNMDTVTPDFTTFYGWEREIETLELGPTTLPEQPVEPGDSYVRGDDDAVYDAALGEFEALMDVAMAEQDLDRRYVLQAKAEAALLDAAVVLPSTTQGGTYAIGRLAPGTVSAVSWGMDDYRYSEALVTTELIKAADRKTMKAKWDELVGSGTYLDWAKGYLTAQGYTLKDSYSLGYTFDPTIWDGLNTYNSTNLGAIALTVDGLCRYDAENRLVPALAESYERSDDGLTYTFHLQPDAVWIDASGQVLGSVTADDFVAGLQHLLDVRGGLESLVAGDSCDIVNAAAYLNGELSDFSQVGVRAIDEATLEYRLSSPCPWFVTMLSSSVLLPLNRDYFLSQGGGFGADYDPDNGEYFYGWDPEHIAYCGPYLVTENENGDHITFTANPHYYDADRLQIKTIRMRFNDGSDMLWAYNNTVNGVIDAAGLNGDAAEQAKADGLFDPYVYLSDTTLTTYFDTLVLNRGAFSLENGAVASAKTEQQKADTFAAMNNANFRRALRFAFDRASYNAVVVGEELKLGNLRNSITPPNFVYLGQAVTEGGKTFDAGCSYGELLQYYLSERGSKISIGDGFDGWYDPMAAKELLAEAIEELGESVSLPIQLDLPYPENSEMWVGRMQVVKRSLEDVLGTDFVQVNLIPTADTAEWLNCIYYPDTGAGINADFTNVSGWGADYGDPSTYLNIFRRNGSMIFLCGLY